MNRNLAARITAAVLIGVFVNACSQKKPSQETDFALLPPNYYSKEGSFSRSFVDLDEKPIEKLFPDDTIVFQEGPHDQIGLKIESRCSVGKLEFFGHWQGSLPPQLFLYQVLPPEALILGDDTTCSIVFAAQKGSFEHVFDIRPTTLIEKFESPTLQIFDGAGMEPAQIYLDHFDRLRASYVDQSATADSALGQEETLALACRPQSLRTNSEAETPTLRLELPAARAQGGLQFYHTLPTAKKFFKDKPQRCRWATRDNAGNLISYSNAYMLFQQEPLVELASTGNQPRRRYGHVSQIFVKNPDQYLIGIWKARNRSLRPYSFILGPDLNEQMSTAVGSVGYFYHRQEFFGFKLSVASQWKGTSRTKDGLHYVSPGATLEAEFYMASSAKLMCAGGASGYFGFFQPDAPLSVAVVLDPEKGLSPWNVAKTLSLPNGDPIWVGLSTEGSPHHPTLPPHDGFAVLPGRPNRWQRGGCGVNY
jgi:hypothetical protein